MKQDIEKKEEIDLLELLAKIWTGRKTILYWFVIFFILGVFIAIFSPKEYTAKTIFVPQLSSGNKLSSGLGGLAAMAGISLTGGASEEISPSIYPKIIQSIPFLRKMSETLIQVKVSEKPISYTEYYQKYPPKNVLTTIQKYTIGLPSLILQSGKTSTSQTQSQTQIYQISSEEEVIFNKLQEQLQLNVNEKEGIVILSFSMEEPLAAAQMAIHAQEYLQQTITEYKIQRAKEKLDFIQRRYDEAQKDFKEKQIRLASFQDSNRGLISSLSQTRVTQLQSEYNLAYNVYSELAKQLETQKIQVKEDTPVFTIIEPVSIPFQKSKPKRIMILAIWSFLGIIIGIGVIFVKDFISSFKKNQIVNENSESFA